MDEQMQGFLINSLGMFFSSEMQACLAKVRETAGYDLSSEHKVPFLAFHKFITDPQPDFISRLRADPQKEHWYHALVNGILGNVQGSFSCVLYHQERVTHTERALMQVLQDYKIKRLPENGSLGLGGTSVLDFEYQAYVLAFRRCLDQLACALAAFFKNKYSSFRTLPHFLGHRKPREVAQRLSDVHAKYVNSFEFVLSEGGVTSVRDRIAHYEFVQAGCFNLNTRGVVLVGGGENLNLPGGTARTLAETLQNKSSSLQQCIAEMIEVFVEEVTKWEANKESFTLKAAQVVSLHAKPNDG
ncbi:MAG TPA: hypothetical protein VFP33_02420 [Gallionella sp.]|nr:hypothetical protein [Gallionella sp.]